MPLLALDRRVTAFKSNATCEVLQKFTAANTKTIAADTSNENERNTTTKAAIDIRGRVRSHALRRHGRAPSTSTIFPEHCVRPHFPWAAPNAAAFALADSSGRERLP
jgi:hypothetical protein